ncbi:putative cytokinetic ring protein SteA [Salibacterium sp. K-3]
MKIWKGSAQYHEQTKRLVQCIHPGDIAVLSHKDIDATAADSLIRADVQAVLNDKTSMSGSIPQDGVQRLVDHHIPVFDIHASGIGPCIHGRTVEIHQNKLYLRYSGRLMEMSLLTRYTRKLIERLGIRAEMQRTCLMEAFFENSLHFAGKELPDFLEQWHSWEQGHSLAGKDACIVIRGADYVKDLQYARKYIFPPDLCRIAVDGAADDMRRIAFAPDYIIGDMDSVSHASMKCGAKLIVHQGPDGDAPGLDHLLEHNMSARTVQFVGLSEDAAAAFALKEGAERIFMVGGHRDMEEYLCKGRPGMGSSLLMRMLAGSRLIDLKGIHYVQDRRRNMRNIRWREKFRNAVFLKEKETLRGLEGGDEKS